MTIHKESLNLFMGGSSSEANLNLFIDNNLGLSHSNNIQFRESISKSNSIKFESDFACSVLDFKWHAEKVKILDDYAFVTYPEYTDINKVHITDTNGGLYRPFLGFRSVNIETGEPETPPETGGPEEIPIEETPVDPEPESGPYSSGGIGSCPDYSLYTDGGDYLILPDLKMNEVIEKWGGEFENLFIIVEYDGWTTDENGNVVNVELPNGNFEIFEYKPSVPWGPSNSRWKFGDSGYPILYSKYLPQKPCQELHDGPVSSRLLQPHVADYDIDRLFEFGGIQDILESLQVVNCYRFGFIGYKNIHYIKYTPIVKCGRVDMYERKHGVITSYSGAYISQGHKLKSGDTIEVVASNGQDPSIASGIKYVQVRDANSFFLYEDSDFTKRVEDVGIKFGIYNCVGNVYDKSSNGWRYKQSIFSPHGRNGECIPQTNYITSFETPDSWSQHLPIPKYFSSCKNYIEILAKDILGGIDLDEYPLSIISDSQINLSNPNLKVRPSVISSGLDCLWAHHESFVHSYRFGSDLDIVKLGPEYYLAIGERGCDKWIFTEKKFFPYNQPHGKCHIFAIRLLGFDYESTLEASSFFNGITPISVSTTQNIFSIDAFCNAPHQTTTSSSLNFFIPKNPHNFTNVSILNDINWANDDYWFGSCLMSRHGMLENLSNSLITQRRTNYSSDLIDPTTPIIFYKTDINPEFTNNGNRFYPFLDSFGKSVALKVFTGVSNELIIAVGSNTKVNVGSFPDRSRDDEIFELAPEYDYSQPSNCLYGQVDFGYIHLFSYFNEMYNKISIPISYDTFSQSYWAQLYTCENFGKCLFVSGDELFFGEPRSPDISSEGLNLNNAYRSKIHSLSIIGEDVSDSNSFGELSTYTNHFNEVMSFTSIPTSINNPLGERVTIDNKTRLIKNQDTYGSATLPKVYISDDFGKNFIVSKDYVVTNSYSLTNTLGQTVNVVCDYVNILDRYKDKSLVKRISPSINKSLTKYDYENTIGLDFPASLVEIGNIHYENTTFDSVTWDTNLANCYAIIDDTFILKDPLGYAFFDTSNWLCFNSVISPEKAKVLASSILSPNGDTRFIESGRISYTNPVIGYGSSSAKYHINHRATVDSWNFLSLETSEFTLDPNWPHTTIIDNKVVYKNYFEDFGTSIDLSRDDYIPFFMPVVDAQFSNFTGYTFGASSDDEPIDLFLKSNLSESSSLDLFIGPITTSQLFNISIPEVAQRRSDKNLDISIYNGNDLSLSDFTIFTKCVDNFRDVNLTLFGPLPIISGVDLMIDPPFPFNKDLSLVTRGGNFSDGQVDILLENYPDNQSRQALLLRISQDPIKVSNDIDLSTRGTLINGSSYQDSFANLFIDSYQGSTGALNLELTVSNSGTVDDSLLLKIYNEVESGSSDSSIVFSMESFGANIFFTPASGIRNLSIKGADIISDNTTLFLKRSGPGGGEEEFGVQNFYVHNTTTSSGVDIFMDSKLSLTENLNLSIGYTVGVEDRNLNVFTRGFEE
jgi:hypothetical protein